MADEEVLRIFIETPAGDRFEADIPCMAKIGQVAGDFFEAMGWPTEDRGGRAQRAVVELVDPGSPDNTKRLNSDRGLCESGLRNGDTLRIIPESRAGSVDYHDRLAALRLDYNEMQNLARQNPKITFTVNRTQAPDLYELTLHHTSFVEWAPGMDEPRKGDKHRVDIMLNSQYPRRAPIVIWKTPIFHPNISKSGGVCLGVLMERYLPGMGLARLVRMLIEMVEWRNFLAVEQAENPEAAKWAAVAENWPIIESIGGHPLQGPIKEYLERLDRTNYEPITFRRVSQNY